MAAKELFIDFDAIDLDNVVADTDEINRYNPQRHEMQQLTAIVYDDPEGGICVGYKDVTDDEFWIRGHMPGMPLMPGVVICEAAAQLCSYHVQRHNLLGAEMVGFGGMDDVRFRDPVLPGQRLVLVCNLMKLRKGVLVKSRFQGFVDRNLVVEGGITGVALPVDALRNAAGK